MDTPEIETQILQVLGRAKGWLPESQLAGLLELTMLGEPRTALEILSIELFAFDVPFPTDLWERLVRLNHALGIDAGFGDPHAPTMYAKSA